MKSRYPFEHPEIEALLDRLHGASSADKWRLAPRLPFYLFAKLTGRANEGPVQRRIFYDVYSAVTPGRGALLYLIVRAIGAKRVVEFGSSFGISTIYLATAVRDNLASSVEAEGRVIGSEMEPHKHAEATKNLQAAGLSGIAAIIPGDALETLRTVEGPVDMVFLDGRKDLYLPVLKLLEPKLRIGAVILSDNIFSFQKEVAPFLEYVRSAKNGFASSSLKISDGVEFSIFQRSEK